MSCVLEVGLCVLNPISTHTNTHTYTNILDMRAPFVENILLVFITQIIISGLSGLLPSYFLKKTFNLLRVI